MGTDIETIFDLGLSNEEYFERFKKEKPFNIDALHKNMQNGDFTMEHEDIQLYGKQDGYYRVRFMKKMGYTEKGYALFDDLKKRIIKKKGESFYKELLDMLKEKE